MATAVEKIIEIIKSIGTKGRIIKPKKIDITAYDVVVRFGMVHKNLMKNETDAYKSGDYLSYIKYVCLSSFFMWSNVAFRGKFENSFSPEIEPFSCFQFPADGTRHDFQAFKKLGIVEKIPCFNESHSRFYSVLAPDWKRIQNIMAEHQQRWKQMPTFEKVGLLGKLHSLYKGRENHVIYVQYFIYENKYLNQPFDRFMSAQDFNEWWERDALKILCPENRFEPKNVWDDLKFLLKTNEGILQSDFYKICNDSKEEVSSTLYFAEKDGELIRKKEGRSYRLYLPEQL
jgi:hypothetical protein